MRTEYFDYLFEIEKCESITEAADNLFISRTSLLYALNTIEKELGYPIFNRSVQGTVVTPAGKKMLREAHEIAPVIKGWVTSQDQKHQEPHRTIALGIASIVRKHVLYEAQMFSHKHLDNVDLEIIDDDPYTPTAISKILRKQSNIVLLSAVPSPYIPELQEIVRAAHFGYISLFRIVFSIYMSVNNPLAKKGMLTRSDLANLPLWGYPRFAEKLLKRDPVLRNLSNRIVLQKGTILAESIWSTIASDEYALFTAGVADVPLEDADESIAVRPFSDFDASMEYFILFPESALTRNEESALIQFLIDQMNGIDFL